MSSRNMVEYYKNLNIAQTAQATKSMANDVRQLKEIAKVQTGLLASNLEFTIKNNIELQNINQTLNNIGFVLTDIASSTLRQEQMHKKHYDSIEREKALKEILYNCKKYIEKVKVLNDPIVTVCGSKNFLELFSKVGFTTKDLSEIADKEYFDERIKDAKNEISKLTLEQKEELENFEYIYSAYHYILDRNFNEDLEQKQELLSEDKFGLIKDFRRNPKDSDVKYENKNRKFKNQVLNLTERLNIEEIQKLLKSRKGVAFSENGKISIGIAIIIGIILYFTIFISIDKTTKDNFLIFIWIIILGASFGSYKVINNYMEKTSSLKEAERVINQLENIKKQNVETEQRNQVIEKQNQEIINGRESKLKDLRNLINSFINEHKGLEEFYAKV